MAMKNAEKQLKELKMALNYCHLNCDEILEDYREYMKRCKHNSKSWDGKDRRIYFLNKSEYHPTSWGGDERRAYE